MKAFADGDIHILVSTTVIEVGIDVPNATVMVIEEAHRFGLAQLHQLRGRIGRGSATSHCILVDNSPEDDPGQPVKKATAPVQPELLETNTNSRLAIMAQTNDGFKIAEEDLKMRGPGEFFGIEQTGIPALHIADLVRDEEELTLARHLAETLLSYRDKLTPETREKIRCRLQRAFGTSIRGVDAG
jgi:ATP-dependent DNA helicase RecG